MPQVRIKRITDRKRYGDVKREEIKNKPGCNSNHLERYSDGKQLQKRNPINSLLNNVGKIRVSMSSKE